MVCRIPLLCDFTTVLIRLPLHAVIRQKKTMAKIEVNGESRVVNLPLNVTELIKELLVENPEMVSVQVNEEFAEREDWDKIQIQEGYKIDFLYFMGGGSR
jgi:sulfur carrier protein